MYSFNHDSDISVRSLINPEKAGRMNVHKDTGSMEWKTRYFVLMSKHFRLYCFESEDVNITILFICYKLYINIEI